MAAEDGQQVTSVAVSSGGEGLAFEQHDGFQVFATSAGGMETRVRLDEATGPMAFLPPWRGV